MNESTLAYTPWQRRLRRRYSTWEAAFYTITWLMALAVYICIFLWLLPDRQHSPLAAATQTLWGLSELVQCLLLVFVLVLIVFLIRAISPFHEPEWITKTRIGIWSCVFLGKMAAIAFLIQGRIDLAVYCAYLPTVIASLFEALAAGAWWSLSDLFTSIPLLYAVHIHSFWMAAAAMVMGPIARWIMKPGWITLLKRKPTLPEYLQRARESDARWSAYTKRKGWPHSKIGSYLKALGYLERWDEAEKELRRLGQRFKPKQLWMAHIAVGQDRYEDAIKIARNAEESPEILALLARTYALMGKRQQALDLMDRLKTYRWFLVGEELAECLFTLGEYDAALVCYERINFGRDQKWLLGVARALNALGSYEEAAFFYRESLTKTPIIDTVQLKELAACYRHLGKTKLALQAERIAESV